MHSHARIIPPPTGKQQPLEAVAWWVILLGPLLYFFALASQYSSNLPLVDDYVAFLRPFYSEDSGQTLFERLWAQHNEHRIFFPRLVAWLQWQISGELNFRVLIVLGALGWVATAVATMRLLRSTGRVNRWEVLPVVWGLMVPVHEENMLWAMASLQNYWSIFFCLTSISLLATGLVGRSALVLLAACLTSGNGLVLIPTGLVVLAGNRQWRAAGQWAVISVLLLVVYFVGYHRVASHPDPWAAIRQPVELIHYLAVFMGGVMPTLPLAQWVGGGVLIGLISLVVVERRNPAVVMLVVYLLGTGLVVALARSGLGPEQAMSSRYRMYSLLGLALSWLPVCRCFPVGAWRNGAIGLATGTAAGAVLATGQGWDGEERMERMRALVRTEYAMVDEAHPSHLHVRGFLEPARQSRLYDGSAAWRRIDRLPVREVAGVPELQSLGPEFSAHVDEYDGRYLQGWAVWRVRHRPEAQYSLYFLRDRRAWRVPALKYERADINPIFRDGGDYRLGGFRLHLPLYVLPPGEYQLAIAIEQDGTQKMLSLERTYREPEAGLGKHGGREEKP